MTVSTPNDRLLAPRVAGRPASLRALRRPFAVALMTTFLVLRAVTSGPPVELDPNSHLATPNARPSLPMTVAGVVLLVPLLVAEPAIGFTFVLCDMNGFGAFFDLDQWGVANVFKFRDLEMGMLLMFGALFWVLHPVSRRLRPTRLGRYLRHVAIAIPAIAILFTLITLRNQDLATTVRYSRQLYVWLFLLVAPQFIRTWRDARRVVVILVAYVALCSALYTAQSLAPPQTILRYSQQMTTGSQTRIWANSLSAIYVGGLAIFAFQLQARRSRPVLWIVFAFCCVAVVMAQGRVLATVFAASIAAMLLHRAVVTGRIALAVRVAVTALLMLVMCTAILWSVGRLDSVVDVWNRRFGEIRKDIQAHEGSWTSRSEMFQYMPLIVSRNGGGVFAPWFGMGLRAMTPAELSPMTFWGVVSPPIWADNGLAGVTFTAGYFGLAMFVLFVATMVWRLGMQFKTTREPLCRSATFAATLYFVFVLPYMFFSSAFLGTWDDALAIVVMLMLAERLRAVSLRRSVAA